ncbi:BNR-4 repeat-containing protein [Planctomycetota bacterium]
MKHNITAYLILFIAGSLYMAANHKPVYGEEKRISLSNTWDAVLEDPVPVALSKPSEKRWGFFQFPAFSPLPDGRILLMFSVQHDSVAEYGNKAPAYVSADKGKTWKTFSDKGFINKAPHMSISKVMNGEYMCIPASDPIDIHKTGLKMPDPAGKFKTYTEILLYDMNKFPVKIQKYFMKLPAYRWTPREKKWKKTAVMYDIRNGLAWTRGKGHKHSRFLPRTWLERPLLCVDKELFYADYRRAFRLDDGSIPPNRGSFCMVSKDNGRTFVKRSTIAVDKSGKDLMGEPMLAVNKNKELVCIIRRAARRNISMMITYSKDRGKTWEKPKPLHNFGVFPAIMLLDCGVMPLTFGRPGVYMSFSLNGLGRKWTDPIPLKAQKGGGLTSKTCGYTSIFPISPNEFLVAYTDFEWKGPDNKAHKAILSRKIRLEKKTAKNTAIKKPSGVNRMNNLVRKKLSSGGSTRGTAYSMSNKIIRSNGQIFTTWLDHVADIQIRKYSIKTDTWSDTVLVGKGTDNHSGPAMTMDSKGFLHIVYGPHHDPFHYKRSLKPYDHTKWEAGKRFGTKGTYPSLICGPDDTLYCTYRSSSTNPWRLLFQKREKQGKWTRPRAIVDAGAKGYSQFGNSLAVSKEGVLHLCFHIYDEKPKGGKAVGYLCSKDGGETWMTAQGITMKTPVFPKSDCFLEQGKALDMRTGNIVLDNKGMVWFTAVHLEKSPRTTLIWHYNGKKWESINLLPHIQAFNPDLEIVGGVITFTRKGYLYAACTVENILKKGEQFWGHPSQEIVIMISRDRGKTFTAMPVSEKDPSVPNWLPSIERPYSHKPIDVPSLMYTHGGPGKGCKEGKATEIQYILLGE